MEQQAPSTACFEKVIYHYGLSANGIYISPKTAAKLAKQIVGTLGIIAAWLEPDPVRPGAGVIMALCEPQVGVQHVPYKPEMEYK